MNNEQETQFQLDMPFMEALERFAGINIKELEEPEPAGDRASPFVKWAGGKRSIINELKAHLPKEFGAYYEPFAGGMATCF